MQSAPPKTGQVRFVILALITALYTLSSGDRATLSVAAPHMARSLALSPVQMGWLFSSFACAYVIGQVPAGWIADRFGARVAALGALILWSLATFLTCLVPFVGAPFLALLALRFLLGLFEAPTSPAAGRVLAAWFPASERGMAGSIYNSAQYFSLVLFTPLMGWLDQRFGWQYIFGVMGVLGLVLAVIWMKSYYAPGNHPQVTPAELRYISAQGAITTLGSEPVRSRRSLIENLRIVLSSRMLLGIYLAQYCISAITWFFVSWFPTYLVRARGFTILEAGFVTALPAICGCIGGLLSGFFSDALRARTGSLTLARKVPISIGLCLSAAMIGCIYAGSSWLVIVLMCLSFFGKGFGSLGWTLIADTAPKELVGLTGGVFNGLSNISGIITPTVIGYLVASGSFDNALIYVGVHGLVAVLSFWLIVGPIERLSVPAARPVAVA